MSSLCCRPATSEEGAPRRRRAGRWAGPFQHENPNDDECDEARGKRKAGLLRDAGGRLSHEVFTLTKNFEHAPLHGIDVVSCQVAWLLGK